MATNLAIDPSLIDKVLELSGQPTKKAAVTLALREFIAQRWAEENKAGIKAFNDDIEKRGLWSDGMRSW